MTSLKNLLTVLPLLVGLLISPAVLANWSLDPAQSHIYFVSTKKE